jgi:hypothetical protein
MYPHVIGSGLRLPISRAAYNRDHERRRAAKLRPIDQRNNAVPDDVFYGACDQSYRARSGTKRSK